MFSHEREPAERDPYWGEDTSLFEGSFRYFRGSPSIVRARIHVDEEHYRLDAADLESAIVTQKSGSRSYVLLKPYVLEPDIILTVGFSPAPQAGQAVGEVLNSTWQGMRQRDIGHAQAWHYPDPTSPTTVLWECFLERHFRDQPLPEDPNMKGLWTSVESYLLTRFRKTAQIITTDKDPMFDDREYQRFLRELGYRPVAQALYGKDVPYRP
jgi:hypothetical protein